MGIAIYHWVILLLYFFSRINTIEFSSRRMAYLDSWSLWLCQVWILSHQVLLKSNQKVVDYSQNICATITSIYFGGRLLL